jgi:hypothetical protein
LGVLGDLLNATPADPHRSKGAGATGALFSSRHARGVVFCARSRAALFPVSAGNVQRVFHGAFHQILFVGTARRKNIAVRNALPTLCVFFPVGELQEQRKEVAMRKLALRKPSLRKLSLGVAAAGALFAATAVPALAQVGVYAGPGGFGFELGAPGYYYGVDPYYGYDGYYDYAPGWNGYYAGPGWRDWHGHHFVGPRR